MQRKYIYANLEKLDNLVFAYGIDQSDFVHGIKRLPANLVSLVGVDDNEHAVNAHTGLNVINDENEIRRYLLQSHALPVKWLDYDEVGDLDFLTIGLVNDMFTERENDDFKYDSLATQEDFDAF